MKVLHVIWHLGQGGGQTYLLNLIQAQQADGDFEPELLVLTDKGHFSEAFEAIVRTRYARMNGGLDVASIRRLPAVLREVGADVIHAHTNNIAFHLVLRGTGTPVVYTEHGGALLGGRRQDRILYRYLSKPIAAFIAISEEMADTMRKANPALSERIFQVYNGIDVDLIEATPMVTLPSTGEAMPAGAFRVGILARLEPQKGIDQFLDTAALVCSDMDDVTFHIIGDGSLRSSLEEQARELGIADRVQFLGYRGDAIGLLKNLDIFLFTSRHEPFGLVVVEAMAAGVPVVAIHNRGAIPEIISDGAEGVVVVAENRATACQQAARAVTYLLRNADRREDIVQQATLSVRRRFSMEENAQGVKRVYQDCLKAAETAGL